jgi:dolichol-phosphate mannosyltransferase
MSITANYAVIVPMANEEPDFRPFTEILSAVISTNPNGTVYFIVDTVSKDKTLQLCQDLSSQNPSFRTIWAPENKNVVDAYLRGYREALLNGHDFIIEMDAGLSHDPNAIPLFLEALTNNTQCVFGSRFIKGGSIEDSNWRRYILSKFGTILSNLLLGTGLHDMTSGFQGFHAAIVQEFLAYPLRSKAHFYQTELRYLLRNKHYTEIPIHYRAPSPRVSRKAIQNSFEVLFYYFFQRVKMRPIVIS